MARGAGGARTAGPILLLAAVVAAGCGRRDKEASLREGLEGLPRDTARSAEVVRDTSRRPSESVPAPFPAPLPRDTRPWVPGERALSLDEWTAAATSVDRSQAAMTTLTGVRTARHDEFDRVVLEFSDEVPGYHLEYVDRPVRKCGSGDPVPMAGDGWLRVRLVPSQAHDDRGRVTVRERALRPGLPILQELRLVCDFEGQVEWVLGVSSPNRYRVLELRDPARLVVDVRHQ